MKKWPKKLSFEQLVLMITLRDLDHAKRKRRAAYARRKAANLSHKEAARALP